MPSTIVHLGLAGLLAAALVRDDHFGRRAVAVVLIAAALPDLDSFLSPVLAGAHRAVGHNLILPAIAAAVLAYDTRVRAESWILARFGASGAGVAWVAIAAFSVAGVGLDYAFNGVNLLWPIHDRFYTLKGRAVLSNQRGFVQTFVEFAPESEPESVRTTDNTHYVTGVDPSPGAEPEDVERVFPLATSGWQLLIAATGYGVLAARFLREARE
ncbi:metal-dependent hydrolase [Halobaculum sp. CBA1158]|uniref:metal-dependent hydrolase n=1 Tax=Halobaculum sp. CBA1158 TaxID=2904243 RepID=UPI001F181886|nr:metal-dependent hydrolase [Halobaculum sp. CBA1158]UIP01142.1 metal-dependent hydrolase [Halobaculum sp. CBA1158]